MQNHRKNTAIGHPSSHQEEEFVKTDMEINQENVKYILMDGYEYCFNRMLGEIQKWKCTQESCYAYFKILDNNKLLPGVMAHTHSRQDEDSSQDANHEEQLAAAPQSVQSPLQTEEPVESQALWNTWDGSRNSGKKRKLGNGKTAMESMTAASPKLNSGFASDSALLDAAYASNATSPTLKSPSPAKSHKLSEVGPPPTPPLSRNSSLHDEDPSSPLPPIIDLVEPKYQFEPDFGLHFFNEPTGDDSQRSTAKPSNLYNPQPSTSASTSSSTSHVKSKRQMKLDKYKEFEKNILQLNNQTFGFAVTSLLNEVPDKTADDLRYEIATLLYDAVESFSDPPKPSSKRNYK